MKRILIEVFLALALVGAGVFGWMNWKLSLSEQAKVAELTTAAAETAKKSDDVTKAIQTAKKEIEAEREEMTGVKAKSQQLDAVKASLANGTTLADLEAAYKTQKNISAERQLGLGALRMLTKGNSDPSTIQAYNKALELSDWGSRKKTICAAQIGLAAAGQKITVMGECLPESATAEPKDAQAAETHAPDAHADEKKSNPKKTADKNDAPHWDYAGAMGPDRWGKEFPTCAKGQSQSPLNITGPFAKGRSNVTTDYKVGALKILNNGHTIQINVPPGSKLRIDSVPFDLLQFHFHRPSEEQIDGKPMAMVGHFVHKNAAGKLAVLSVLFKVGNENPGIKTLWANAPPKEGPEVAPDGITFNPSDLLPRELDFYSYEGSLTTPPCTEGVSFYVLKSSVNISKEQVNAFPFRINARPVQPRNGRVITSS
jgi:carbonic anhydrase